MTFVALCVVLFFVVGRAVRRGTHELLDDRSPVERAPTAVPVPGMVSDCVPPQSDTKNAKKEANARYIAALEAEYVVREHTASLLARDNDADQS